MIQVQHQLAKNVLKIFDEFNNIKIFATIRKSFKLEMKREPNFKSEWIKFF